jgi:hypothetical protein
MPLPTASDVHVNAPLTNISIAYIQAADQFIAARVFPNVPVSKQSDRYFMYLKQDWFRTEARERAPGTESAGDGWRIDNTPTYYAPVYAVHKDVDDQIRANQDNPINMDRDATLWVTTQLLLKRERIWADSYFQPTVWDTDLQGVDSSPGPGQFLRWNKKGSRPFHDITNAAIGIAQKTGFRPNTLVLSPFAFNSLRHHPDVLDRIKYTQRGVVTTEIMAGLFDVARVFVPWGVINYAAEGVPGDDDFEFVFGKSALLCYANPTPSILQPSGGYIFSWTGFLGAGQEGNRIKRFRMEHLSADRVEGEMAFDARLVASDLGVFFHNAVDDQPDENGNGNNNNNNNGNGNNNNGP